MYCGMSLARVGLDFRGLLPPVFEACILAMFSKVGPIARLALACASLLYLGWLGETCPPFLYNFGVVHPCNVQQDEVWVQLLHSLSSQIGWKTLLLSLFKRPAILHFQHSKGQFSAA